MERKLPRKRHRREKRKKMERKMLRKRHRRKKSKKTERKMLRKRHSIKDVNLLTLAMGFQTGKTMFQKGLSMLH
uniref:Uncharacterized protein n=1 Tax=Picea sitchensis TaxID=3332 RepID=A9NJZ6_PICSI|nr:unknown [Picea sitchensis]